MDRNGEGKIVSVVYKGDNNNVLLHTMRLEDGTNRNVYNSNLQLLVQPDFLNMPKNKLNYRNEVVTGLTLDISQALARPSALSPPQHYLMICNHLSHHLPYRILFRPARIGFLTKRLIRCQNKLTLCFTCQFFQSLSPPLVNKEK